MTQETMPDEKRKDIATTYQKGKEAINYLFKELQFCCDDKETPAGYSQAHAEALDSLDRLGHDALRADLPRSPSEALEFVRDCADNWDCDTDGHKYDTGCRKCEAAKILALQPAAPSQAVDVSWTTRERLQSAAQFAYTKGCEAEAKANGYDAKMLMILHLLAEEVLATRGLIASPQLSPREQGRELAKGLLGNDVNKAYRQGLLDASPQGAVARHHKDCPFNDEFNTWQSCTCSMLFAASSPPQSQQWEEIPGLEQFIDQYKNGGLTNCADTNEQMFDALCAGAEAYANLKKGGK